MQHSIDEDDCQNVLATLRGKYLTQGPSVQAFEKEIAQTLEVQEAVAVNSGTSALHVAYLALGLGPGDILWTTPNSFVATANAALMCGAKVDFVDIDPDSYNICEKKLEKRLISARAFGSLPKIVVPVHFSGNCCNLEKIKELSEYSKRQEEIEINLNQGQYSFEAYTCDFTHEYIDINADYRN